MYINICIQAYKKHGTLFIIPLLESLIPMLIMELWDAVVQKIKSNSDPSNTVIKIFKYIGNCQFKLRFFKI